MENLEAALKMSLPRKSELGDVGASPIARDCGICYCRDLTGKIPELQCSNNTCQQIYHYSCLELVSSSPMEALLLTFGALL